MAAPSQVPTRLPGGATTDPPYGPFADSGYGNPAFYHQFFDDFDNALATGVSGLYTVTTVNGGTATHQAGDGGIGQVLTGAVSGNYTFIQLPAADFTLPQGTLAGKKLFFGARVSLSSLTSNFICGLCNTSATPFTAITDGVYFWHPTGGAVLNLLTVSASTTLTWTIPTSAYTLAAGSLSAGTAQIDLGFYIDRYQNINVFVGSQLFGWLPQSGTGGVSATTGVSTLPVVGPALRIYSAAYAVDFPVGGSMVGPWTISSANLNPTFGIQTQSAAAINSQIDFWMTQKER